MTRPTSLPDSAIQHFKVTRPTETHFRAATCKEVACTHYLLGWLTVVPVVSPQADYIRHQSGRRFTEKPLEGGLVEFTFSPFQRCFRSDRHVLPNGTAPILTRRAGAGIERYREPAAFTAAMNEASYQAQKQRKEG